MLNDRVIDLQIAGNCLVSLLYLLCREAYWFVLNWFW